MPPTNGAAVTHHGDAHLHRLATEHRRLTLHRDAIDQVIASHTTALRAALIERDTTRLELDDGLHIRRDGPTGIVVTNISDRVIALTSMTRHSA